MTQFHCQSSINQVTTLIISILLVTFLVCASGLTPALPHPIPGQVPQVGNGFVATFVNRSQEYVAGVFTGYFTNSQRATFPATTFVLLECAVPQTVVSATGISRYMLNETQGIVRLKGSCSLPEQQKQQEEKADKNIGNRNNKKNSIPLSTVSNTTSSIDFEHFWYAHRKVKELLVLEIMVSNPSDKNVSLPLVDLHEQDPSDNGLLETIFKRTFMCCNGKYEIETVVYETTETEVAGMDKTQVAVAKVLSPPTVTAPANSHNHVVHRQLSARTSSLDRHTLNTTDLATYAETTLLTALATPSEVLVIDHLFEWGKIWESGLDTDSASAQGVIRGSQYAIHSSLRADVPHSTSPGGLTTNGYHGHTFWDMETWVMPNLMLFHPDIAVGAGFQYRLDRILGAKTNAKVTVGINYGIAFPWESAATGTDVCPAPNYAKTELHVTPDVVGAIRLYYRLTKNQTFLRNMWPILNETSLFWVYRSRFGADGTVHIDDVTPPDEYHTKDDTIYTNFAVQTAVKFTLEAAEILSINASQIPEVNKMKQIVKKMKILYDPPPQNFHPEYAGYTDQIVKQADVILLQYPWNMTMMRSTAINDLDFYLPKTIPNLSGAATMTWSMFAVNYLAVGAREKGVTNFYQGYNNCSFPPYWQWYSQLGGHGNDNFITGAGGFLQSVWAGLGGLRFTSEEILILPQSVVLLDDAKYLAINHIHYRNVVFSLYYYRQGEEEEEKEGATHEKKKCNTIGGSSIVLLRVTLNSSPYHNYSLTVNGGHPLEIGESVVVNVTEFQLQNHTSPSSSSFLVPPIVLRPFTGAVPFTTAAPHPHQPKGLKKTTKGIIAGCVIGGLAVLAVAIGIIRSKLKSKASQREDYIPITEGSSSVNVV